MHDLSRAYNGSTVDLVQAQKMLERSNVASKRKRSKKQQDKLTNTLHDSAIINAQEESHHLEKLVALTLLMHVHRLFRPRQAGRSSATGRESESFSSKFNRQCQQRNEAIDSKEQLGSKTMFEPVHAHARSQARFTLRATSERSGK